MTRLAAKATLLGAAVVATLAGWGVLSTPPPPALQVRAAAATATPQATPGPAASATPQAPATVATPTPTAEPPQVTRPAPVARSRTSR